MIQVNDRFPEFTLQDQNGKEHNHNDYTGKWLVVYFYPKDNTSGCTLEAKDFAALSGKFTTAGTAIIGVSPDSIKSHCNFADKHSLPFTLLSDPEHILLEKSGVWQTKRMAGKEYMGVVRTTFLVDPKGIIREIWSKVKVAGHAEAVLEKMARLRG